MARKPVYRRGEIMSSAECDIVLCKGNLSDEEFNRVLECAGYDPVAPEKIQRGWWRCEQQGDSRHEYTFLLQPTKPHARGAFEATWKVW